MIQTWVTSAKVSKSTLLIAWTSEGSFLSDLGKGEASWSYQRQAKETYPSRGFGWFIYQFIKSIGKSTIFAKYSIDYIC